MTTPLKVHGVDISHHQGGKLDFAAAKRVGVVFVYHKATEGVGWVDEKYKSRRAEVAKAGLVFGAYHFARPSVGDAKAEANHFIEVAKPKVGDLLPALDLETSEGLTPTQLDLWASVFVSEVKRLTGFGSVVYTPFNLPSVSHCPLWMARYSNSNTPPTVPPAWKKMTIRQFSNGEFGVPNSVPGIGHVDLNTWGPKSGLADVRIKMPVEFTGRGSNIDGAAQDLKVAHRRSEDDTFRQTLIERAQRILKLIKPTR